MSEDEEEYSLAGDVADGMEDLVLEEGARAEVRGEGVEGQLDDYQVLVLVNETWEEEWVDEGAKGYQDDYQVLELVGVILDVVRDEDDQ